MQSKLMLGAARERFADDNRIELVEHDLDQPLPPLGRFDAVVSSFAIHHLEHERKRSLYGEVFDMLEPGGVFANFEHVASPTHRLHLAFYAAISEPLEEEDPPITTVSIGTGLSGNLPVGILVQDDSTGTLVERNTTSDNHGHGIEVKGESSKTLIRRNRANDNDEDGIDLDNGGITVKKNIANHNGHLEISAVPGVTDGGGNRAFGNGNPLQCLNVVCK